MRTILGFDISKTDRKIVLRAIDRHERHVIDEIGGDEAVAALNTAPLGDEPFDRSVVPDRDKAIVADILERADRACDEVLDVQMRTICRRYLAGIVQSDPTLFNRSQRADLFAAGLVWAAIRVQRLDEQDEPNSLPTRLGFAEMMGVSATTLLQRANSLEAILRRNQLNVGAAAPWHSWRRRLWLNDLEDVKRWRGRVDAPSIRRN